MRSCIVILAAAVLCGCSPSTWVKLDLRSDRDASVYLGGHDGCYYLGTVKAGEATKLQKLVHDAGDSWYSQLSLLAIDRTRKLSCFKEASNLASVDIADREWTTHTPQREAISRSTICEGMTWTELRFSWGFPDKRDRTQAYGVTADTLFYGYRKGKAVWLRNGIVTGWTDYKPIFIPTY